MYKTEEMCDNPKCYKIGIAQHNLAKKEKHMPPTWVSPKVDDPKSKWYCSKKCMEDSNK